MKRGFLKLIYILYSAVAVLFCLFSIFAGAMVLASQLTSLNATKYVYTFFSEIMIPVQYLFNIGLSEAQNVFIAVSLGSAIFVLFLGFLALRDIGRAFDNRQTAEGKKLSNVYIIIFSLIMLAFSIYGVFINIFHHNEINTYLASRTFDGWQNLVMTKQFVIYGILILLSILFLIYLLFIRTRDNNRVREIGSLYFYSGEYEESQTQTRTKTEEVGVEQEVEPAGIKEFRPQAQDLVQKIMELNKLKENGEISAKEYTKLRQSAIRRYKG